MKTLFVILVLFLLGLASNSYAYDWDRCRREWIKVPLYGLTGLTTMSPIQYISSWGGCSAVGDPEYSKEAFFNDNYNFVRRDFAANYGEYKNAFLELFECNEEGKDKLNNQIRSNFEMIFAIHIGKRLDEESIEINYNKLMSIAKSDSSIYLNCESMR